MNRNESRAVSEELITEDDIATYLMKTPEFFERYSEILLGMQLISPRGQRAVSLQERQMELLRDKIKGLELRMAHMIRAGSENDQIHSKMHEWILPLLKEAESENIPTLLVDGLKEFFNVPQVALRAWTLSEIHSSEGYAQDVSTEVRTFVNGLGEEPYCGQNAEVEVLAWLDAPADIRSIALLPLKMPTSAEPFGLIVLGATDAQRFTSEMGVDILKSIANFASAALSRCIN